MRTTKAMREWVSWLTGYGLLKFCKAFVRNAQGAQSTCRHCHEHIYLDILEGGGVTDWKTKDGDYGCHESPDTCTEGTGSHMPLTIDD
jgi:hypothetical protein